MTDENIINDKLQKLFESQKYFIAAMKHIPFYETTIDGQDIFVVMSPELFKNTMKAIEDSHQSLVDFFGMKTSGFDDIRKRVSDIVELERMMND